MTRVPSLRNPADLETKVFPADRLQLLRQLCGVKLPVEIDRAKEYEHVQAIEEEPRRAAEECAQCAQCAGHF